MNIFPRGHSPAWIQGAGILLAAFCLLGARLNTGELEIREALSYRVEGRRYQEVGKFQEAEIAYRKAIQFNPQYADAYNDLGVVLENRNDLVGAEQAYRAALQANPRLSGAHTNLALLLERTGRLQEAQEHWATRVRMGKESDPWAMKAREKLSQHNVPIPEPPKATAKTQNFSGTSTKKSAPLPSREQNPMVHKESPKEHAGKEHAGKESAPTPRPMGVKKPVPAVPAEGETVSPEAKALASEMVREKAKVRSQSSSELYQRAVTATRQGRYQEAVTLFEQILTLDPNHSVAEQGLKRAQAALAKQTKSAQPK